MTTATYKPFSSNSLNIGSTNASTSLATAECNSYLRE